MSLNTQIKKLTLTIVVNLFLLLIAFIFMLPVFWMISTAFKVPEQIAVFPPQWIPDPITLRAFREGFDFMPFGQFFWNSTLIAVLGTTGTLISCSLAAFGFAKMKAKLKSLWFTLMISTLMIPGTVTLIPTFFIFSRLGWIDTYLPLILPAWFGASAFSIFLLRQFFASIPNELSEAALIDGSGWFRIYGSLYLPNSKPAMLVVMIFAVVHHWNDFFAPMIYLTSTSNYTLAIGLNAFRHMHGGAMDTGPMMAMALISVLPILIIYLFTQKFLIQGVVTSGLKG